MYTFCGEWCGRGAGARVCARRGVAWRLAVGDVSLFPGVTIVTIRTVLVADWLRFATFVTAPARSDDV